MTLNHLLHLSSMIVLITSMPNIPTTGTTETLEETADHHNEDNIAESCVVGNITLVKDDDSHELGELLGTFRPTFYSLDYGINGSFYTIKDKPHQIYIHNFTYNGNAPLVYFYVGLTIASGVNNFYVPSDYRTYDPCDIKDGFLVPFIENKDTYKNESVILNLPSDYTIYNIRWVMIWCRVFALDMGQVWNDHHSESSRRKRESSTPEATDMLLLGSIAGRMYDVKGDVYAIDSNTLFLSNFSYNGKAPDAYFYAGSTETVGGKGTILPDENGSMKSIGEYIDQNVTLHLPGGLTIKDFKWLSIFCDSFLEDFGHIRYDHLDDDSLDMLDEEAFIVQPNDTSSSENQTEALNDLERNNKSNVSEDIEQEAVTVSAEDYESDKEEEVVPVPEPGVDTLSPRSEKTESIGMTSLACASHYVIPIAITLYFLLR